MTSANTNTATLVQVARLKSRLLHRLTKVMIEVIAAEEGGDETRADALLVSAVEEITRGISDQGLPGEVFDECRLSALFLEARRQVERYPTGSGSPHQPAPDERSNAASINGESVRNVSSAAETVTETGRRHQPGDLDIASLIDDMLSRSR